MNAPSKMPSRSANRAEMLVCPVSGLRALSPRFWSATTRPDQSHRHWDDQLAGHVSASLRTSTLASWGHEGINLIGKVVGAVRGSLVRRLAVVVTACLLLALAGCERYALDREMQELCKKDGGIKVYETVTLPPEMFDQNGDPFPGWLARHESLRLGADYRLVQETVYLKQGDPLRGEGRLVRSRVSVVRSADNKTLAEGILYGRSGGDFIVVDHFSSSSCPQRLGLPRSVIHGVFIKGGN